MSKSAAAANGHTLWQKMPKANAELFALTYGTLVTELVRDYETTEEINEQLEKMGYSIGVRCVDEFLAKADQANMVIPQCRALQETAEVLAKTGFRMFLGISAEVQMVNESSFSLLIYENPLALFVELPQEEGDKWKALKYSNLYCGIIRGALEQVNLRVECKFVKDILQGDDANEIRVELKEVLADGAGDEYKEE
uniref:Trafficking protein particle complex subunit n=1 Tax=Cyclophora tenuis TaxID=216820 RepID=A0A7S1CY18_CYCTE|mmetsp:Transcript_1152/g.2126  ORF Transcript_1152/g.2126 Transcript_1152/m.2126 type:complete len:196 (+) Transcript_1152:110-697(+)|eukprot:CAMPEP_0116556974 /NCGR_PEP_ID=MMETSP0397-20121206/8988_1 /TAXON_ID=216820 /ORGANISM="Cyclophora tenuis, Strain ECT3854" /LENGTH=195 /DNA_ID=CAMNT_0004082391 /DNA_START=103 /DNA_END=690 /DNA_ORIENTATION=-